jgi:phosphoribosylformylglycinamidine cyclo-ligase
VSGRRGEEAYRAAGVHLDAAVVAMDHIRDLAGRASSPGVVSGVGGFAGLFSLGDGRLLAAATDGVGTKLEVARMAGRVDTVGIDLVAMSANDVVCTGAAPLFFLDYLAVERLVPAEVSAIVSGVAEGCRRAGCALLGGETAEHPGTMGEGRFDLAGFCVGVVAEDDLLGPHRVQAGDEIVGLLSRGLHSNGYTLVRAVLLDGERARSLDEIVDGTGRTLGAELLEPTEIYVRTVLALARDHLIRSAAHITGGGFPENVPRALPDDLGAGIERGRWRPPPIFGVVAAAAGVAVEDLYGVLNMGVGMVVIVPRGHSEEVVDIASSSGTPAVVIGEVTDEPGFALT